MAITIYSDDEISAQVLSYFRTRFPGRDLSTESFLGKVARAVAMGLVGLQKAVKDADNDSTPSQYTSSTALDNFAILFGLSDGESSYGRKKPTTATGGVAPFTGSNGTVYNNGTVLVASDGVTTFQVIDGPFTISGTSVTGHVAAVSAGSSGNLPSGSVLTWQSPPVGSASTITLSSGVSGGTDAETDAALLQRIFDRLQKPPKGGTAVDYRTWAEATPDAGIGRAYVYPLRGGLGTVHAVCTKALSGKSRDPGSSNTALVQAYVDTQRPVGMAGFVALQPYQPGSGRLIRLRMTPSKAAYNFDWIDTAASYTVDLVTAGPPIQIRLNTTAPASLTAAIDAGSRPRIQIASTGTNAAAVPPMVSVTAWSTSGGKTTLTLDTSSTTGTGQTGWSTPNVSDAVYAGGPMCTTIGNAILDYIDGLGPSRASGYADPNDAWEDTMAIARLIQVALDQVDTDGVTHFASNTVSVTIDGASTDVVASDTSGTNAPELLFAEWVLVTQ